VTTVNANLEVGALEETITVTGETPVVDVQSTIGGLVKDTSGAVLPGVTFEASSKALIERLTRLSATAPASTASLICIPAPTPVTFTLPGFNTFKRGPFELATSFACISHATV